MSYYSNFEEIQSRHQVTNTGRKGAKAAPPREPALWVPMVWYENREQLNDPHIREICATDSRINERCIMCERFANPAHTCKTCKSALYCSDECQTDDKPQHSLVCSQWAAFAQPPHKAAYRMLVFPAKNSTPVFAWTELLQFRGEPSPRLAFPHPEAITYTQELCTTPVRHKVGRMGCVNACRAVAATKKMGLGHGLFVLEFVPPPPPASTVGAHWLNRSIPRVTALAPGQTWIWTGPVGIVALDVDRTDARAGKYALSHVGMRDVRHAVDYFALNMRNSGVPSPLGQARTWDIMSTSSPKGTTTPTTPTTTQTTTKSRYPFPTLPAIKLNEPNTAVAREMGVTAAVEQVCISRSLPRPLTSISQDNNSNTTSSTATTTGDSDASDSDTSDSDTSDTSDSNDSTNNDNPFPSQGLSALCALLGLTWAVRVVLGHGAEVDWLYGGILSSSSARATASGAPTPASTATNPAKKDSRKDNEGSIIPPALSTAFTFDPQTEMINPTELPRLGDGMVLMHASDRALRVEHVQALLAFIRQQEGLVEDYRLAAGKEEDFRAFWKQFVESEGIPDDVPSPYELEPTLSGLKPGHRFVVCKDVLKQLVPRAAPGLRMQGDGLCVRR